MSAKSEFNLAVSKKQFSYGAKRNNLALQLVAKFSEKKLIGCEYMAESIMLDKSKNFAVEIINMCKNIKETKRESVLTNQLMRSGTSIGANIHESKYAHGTADFISKMQIALKECYESEYWLELLNRTGYIEEEKYKQILNNCGQIRRMLISSINTVKNKTVDRG